MYHFVKLLLLLFLYSGELTVLAFEELPELISCKDNCPESKHCVIYSGGYKCVLRERNLQSKHKQDERAKEIEEIDNLRAEARQLNDKPAGYNQYRPPQQHEADKPTQVHSVQHGSHIHPLKDKLQAVHQKATTLTPPVQPKRNHEHDHHKSQPSHHRIKAPKSEEHEEHHSKGVIGEGGHHSGKEHKHHNEEVNKHHKHKGKIEHNTGDGEKVFHLNREHHEKTTTKPNAAFAHPVAPQAIQSKPGMDNRHSKIKEYSSMADVYFLENNVVPNFKVVDDKQGSDEILLQSKDPDKPKAEAVQSNKNQNQRGDENSAAGIASGNALFIAVVAGCSIAGLVGLVVAGVCWYRLQKNVKAASEAEYPAYGVTGPSREKVGSPGDRKLAQSAQMYHYQHQKQQMLAMERASGDMGGNGSDADSEEENEEGDYTVYECPGLAPTGEMEVKNPLFNDDTPVSGSNGEPQK